MLGARTSGNYLLYSPNYIVKHKKQWNKHMQQILPQVD